MGVWGKLTPGVAALGKKKSTSALPVQGGKREGAAAREVVNDSCKLGPSSKPTFER